MSNSTVEQKENSECKSEKKPGFFGRIFQKMDASMKAKAEAKGESCCGGDDSKGGKCC